MTVVAWLGVLGFVSGPVRWEIQHSYAHWIGDSRGDLPALTETVSLPVLGLGPHAPFTQLVRFVFWTVLWLPPVLALELVRRADSRLKLLELLVLVGTGYIVTLLLAITLVALGLWLPFALL